MFNETNKTNDLVVKKVNFTLEQYLRDYIRDCELSEAVRNSDIVLLPYNSFREYKGPLFPEATIEFYNYLATNSKGKRVELCVEEEDYKELAMHNEVFNLGVILLNSLIMPLLVCLIMEYVKSKRGEKKVDVKVTLIQKDENGYQEFQYEGDSKYIVETFDTYLRRGYTDDNR